MRSLLLILLLANLVLFAAQFDVVRGLVIDSKPVARPAQVSAERLRIVRDAPPAPRAEPAPATAEPP